MDSIQENLQITYDQLLYAFQVHSCCYQENGELLYTNQTENPFLLQLFNSGDCYELMKQHFQTSNLPILLSNKMGFTWICVCENSGTDCACLYHISGPFFTVEASELYIRNLCFKLRISDDDTRKYLENFKFIPTISLHYALCCCVMLEYGVNERTISENEIEILNEAVDAVPEENWDNQEYHGTWEMEQQLKEAIKKGDFKLYKSIASSKTGSVGMISNNNPLRQAKNEYIVFVAISIRSAIEGGLSPEAAYNISDYYIRRIELCNTVKEVESCGGEMIQILLTRVKKSRMNREHYSSTIYAVTEYIGEHLKEKIVLADMASHLGYTPYYLSHQFQKETNISINQYIKQEKIEFAKNQLRSTMMNIADISDSLCFSSPSYFAATFQQLTGMTPKEYRESMVE